MKKTAENRPKFTLRRFNDVLSIIVIGLCLYVILAPLWPQAQLKLQDAPPLVVSEEKQQPARPEKNTLVIPRIKLQQEIHENAVADWGLAKGIWRDPKTSSPDLGKNTVLSGHRFTYAGASVLYHMDKVKKGDKIVVYWNKVRYEYQVNDIREVAPTAVEILEPTEGNILTVYTCTPLWSAKNRLVLRAELVGGPQ